MGSYHLDILLGGAENRCFCSFLLLLVIKSLRMLKVLPLVMATLLAGCASAATVATTTPGPAPVKQISNITCYQCVGFDSSYNSSQMNMEYCSLEKFSKFKDQVPTQNYTLQKQDQRTKGVGCLTISRQDPAWNDGVSFVWRGPISFNVFRKQADIEPYLANFNQKTYTGAVEAKWTMCYDDLCNDSGATATTGALLLLPAALLLAFRSAM